MLCSRKLPLAKTFGVRSLDLTPFLFPRLLGGSISPDRKLPSGKPGPPCKSGQLKKDLGLEVSSARHAARLEISEVMKFFFVSSNSSSPEWDYLRSTDTLASPRRCRAGSRQACR